MAGLVGIKGGGKKGTLQHEGRPNPDPNYPRKITKLEPQGEGGSRPHNERMNLQKDNFVGNPIAKMGDGRSIGSDGTKVIDNAPGNAGQTTGGTDHSKGVPKTRIDGQTPTRELND